MIHVFKTSVRSRKDLLQVTPLLNRLQPSGWNFDLKDCDHILRVEGAAEIALSVIQLLQSTGFVCEELAD